jgi:hypothetical protein
MATHYKTHTFQTDGWETLDTYWNSPFSYWACKGMRVEPPVPLRIRVLGSVVAEHDTGWINYGGPQAMLIQTVQARGEKGRQIRVRIDDEPVTERGDATYG